MVVWLARQFCTRTAPHAHPLTPLADRLPAWLSARSALGPPNRILTPAEPIGSAGVRVFAVSDQE